MKQQRKKEKLQYKTKKQNAQNTFHEDQAPKAPKNGKIKGNQQLPTIQDMLQIPKENRTQKTFEYFKKIKPFLHSYIVKKQGSRVAQLMFKWGNAEIKNQIHKDILKNWKELIKSNYALHVISKVSVQFQFPKLVEDAIILQNNKEGSMVLQHFINNHPNSPKTNELYKKFQQIYNQAATKGPESQQILHNLAMKSLQKAYYANKISKLIIKLALPTMFQAQKLKTIQFFAQRSLQLFTDEQGIKLFVDLFNYFDSKQKKNIFLKQVKGHINEILSMRLIKILTEVDDTVAVGNKLIPELLQNLNLLEDENSKLYNVLISILSPRNNNFNCLGKIERNVTFSTCKKPQQTRKKQIRQFIYPYLTQYLTSEDKIAITCKNINLSRLSLGLIKSMQSDASQNLKPFVTKIAKYFLSDFQSAKIDGSKKIAVQNTLVVDPFGSKLIKNILILQETFVDKYCDKFSQLFKNNLQKVLYSNASFVLTVLIQKGRNQLMQQIKRIKVDYNKVKARQFYQSRLKIKKN